jgi:hypothetical protein
VSTFEERDGETGGPQQVGFSSSDSSKVKQDLVLLLVLNFAFVFFSFLW